MSERRARFIGHPDGVHLTVPVATEGEPPRHVYVKHNGELPNEIDGHRVPAEFRKTLLEQENNWSEVRRATGSSSNSTSSTSSTVPPDTNEKEASGRG